MALDDFEELVADAIRVCLTNLIGPNAANGLNFYLDPHIAVKNPQLYVDRLKSISGKAADVILRRIENEISQKAGLEKREWLSLDECLAAAHSSVSPRPTVHPSQSSRERNEPR